MRQLYKQQLHQVVLEKGQVDRQFRGVQDSTMKGELFGVENLFQYSSSSILKELRIKYGGAAASRSESASSSSSSPPQPSSSSTATATATAHARNMYVPYIYYYLYLIVVSLQCMKCLKFHVLL